MREVYSERKLFFGMTFRPQKRPRPSSATERHDVALALDRPELKAERGKQPLQGRDHAGTRQLGALSQQACVQANEIGNEQEQATHTCCELPRREREVAYIGDGLDRARTIELAHQQTLAPSAGSR